MKKFWAISFLFLFTTPLFSNGVAITNAQTGLYLTLVSSEVLVNVEDQVSITTTLQVFRNNFASGQFVKYAFPLNEGASGTNLRWYINGEWHTAVFSPTPQDTTLPGGTPNQNLTTYLGETPLYFSIDEELASDSLLIVELTYVELLPYQFGKVSFLYPNNYGLIQYQPLNKQEITFNLTSQRTIDEIIMLSHTPSSISNNGFEANIHFVQFESQANQDYHIQYSLNINELGLFSLSTVIADSLLPDSLGSGFFVFIAEPDPNEGSSVINKVFTFVIDRSGSMYGNKMVQARNAASFIVNNLNEGDKFNIIDFATNVTSFRNEHVPFTLANKNAALAYIANIQANGWTNISGSFSVAIPQFASANDSTANIIIFLTDGEATSGITNTQGILNHVQQLQNQNETQAMIFSFGIGTDVSQQLLTLLSTQNNGFAEFLMNDELESRISEFYMMIRNPVLLNTSISIEPNLLSEMYPVQLPNLYKGEQLIVAGRYFENPPVQITLSGTAFGQQVNYQYTLNLTDTSIAQYSFLTKIWAKKKIEHLLIIYYGLNPNSTQALAIKEEIIKISVSYGIISPFTSFSGGGTTGVESEEDINETIQLPEDYTLAGNYPNPFNPSTTIVFNVGRDIVQSVTIRIYNTLGELIRTLTVDINGSGTYRVNWNGLNEYGAIIPSGNYIYVVDFGTTMLAGKMTMLK